MTQYIEDRPLEAGEDLNAEVHTLSPLDRADEAERVCGYLRTKLAAAIVERDAARGALRKVLDLWKLHGFRDCVSPKDYFALGELWKELGP